ncbi:MAG: class I SAM-dependent methyltransferase [Acidimicrobiales bacterium]
MLSDRVRVDTYHQGIRQSITPGDVVLDLGTGSGLLAFMASRAGAAKVYAVEHSDFIDVAREIAAANHIHNVEFVQANSRDYTPPESIDVVLHEQMGDELFNENMVQNLLDLRDRVLAPGGRIIPARFRLYVEPVSLHDTMRVRRFWNIELPDGIDLGSMVSSPTAARFNIGPAAEQVWARPGSVASTIGEPTPVLAFDLNTLEGIDALPTDHVVERVAATDAIIDGVCVWFEAIFDDDTVLSTSPLEPVTSWGNRMFRLDSPIAAGDKIRIYVHMDDLVDPRTWSIEVL